MNNETQSPDCRQVAVGRAIGHHGEILQGVFRDGDGRPQRGLVTLPMRTMRSVVTAWRRSDGQVRVQPAAKSKAVAAARLALRRFGPPAAGVDLLIDSNIPVGFGLGSSTADVVAVLRAVVGLFGAEPGPDQLLAMAVAAEHASDGTMFSPDAVLVAHRDGQVLETLGGRLPPVGMVSINTAPDRPVDTLAIARPSYNAEERAAFDRLRAQLRRSVATQDPALMGRVGTASALINQRFLPHADLETLYRLAITHGGFGIQVAHSGRVVGLLIPPDLTPGSLPIAQLIDAVGRLGHRAEFLSADDLG